MDIKFYKDRLQTNKIGIEFISYKQFGWGVYLYLWYFGILMLNRKGEK